MYVTQFEIKTYELNLFSTHCIYVKKGAYLLSRRQFFCHVTAADKFLNTSCGMRDCGGCKKNCGENC